MKPIFSVKAKTEKLAAKALGVITAAMSMTVNACASTTDTSGGGVWSSVSSWINTNADGLKTVANALILLCIVAAAIMIVVAGSHGLEKVKGWLIGIVVAVILLTFGSAFLSTLSAA